MAAAASGAAGAPACMQRRHGKRSMACSNFPLPAQHDLGYLTMAQVWHRRSTTHRLALQRTVHGQGSPTMPNASRLAWAWHFSSVPRSPQPCSSLPKAPHPGSAEGGVGRCSGGGGLGRGGSRAGFGLGGGGLGRGGSGAGFGLGGGGRRLDGLMQE